ncbi:hypothetical protein [Rhodococcoides kyotonense]|uniref:Uncharacterized protein n=1 Tax=Rhodococcoides kyotonense TaxID=398843 RepID=A0A239K8N9_9NOCA|nr:hypothetical protein [Rhodococcus kyotonensis]SNT14330.1 hypothetical protein SAMN05421642_1102 [Rhodococcus kyotonensis]
MITIGPRREFLYGYGSHLALDALGGALIVTRIAQHYTALAFEQVAQPRWFGDLKSLFDADAEISRFRRLGRGPGILEQNLESDMECVDAIGASAFRVLEGFANAI